MTDKLALVESWHEQYRHLPGATSAHVSWLIEEVKQLRAEVERVKQEAASWERSTWQARTKTQATEEDADQTTESGDVQAREGR